MIGEKRYDGYSVELIDKISKILNFSYVFELVPDGNYGSYKEENKSWDGLIQRLREHVRIDTSYFVIVLSAEDR